MDQSNRLTDRVNGRVESKFGSGQQSGWVRIQVNWIRALADVIRQLSAVTGRKCAGSAQPRMAVMRRRAHGACRYMRARAASSGDVPPIVLFISISRFRICMDGDNREEKAELPLSRRAIEPTAQPQKPKDDAVCAPVICT
ncbi:hypothetical protein NL676_012974 [Syzygium grande]|nr:hypothetical protein NL676_012974 [Syzygium grande]